MRFAEKNSINLAKKEKENRKIRKQEIKKLKLRNENKENNRVNKSEAAAATTTRTTTTETRATISSHNSAIKKWERGTGSEWGGEVKRVVGLGKARSIKQLKLLYVPISTSQDPVGRYLVQYAGASGTSPPLSLSVLACCSFLPCKIIYIICNMCWHE